MFINLYGKGANKYDKSLRPAPVSPYLIHHNSHFLYHFLHSNKAVPRTRKPYAVINHGDNRSRIFRKICESWWNPVGH